MQRFHGAAEGGVLQRIAKRLVPSSSQLRVARGLAPYVWPSDRPDLQATVVISLVLMLVAKLVTVAMPFTFKWATDALVAALGRRGAGRPDAVMAGRRAGAGDRPLRPRRASP